MKQTKILLALFILSLCSLSCSDEEFEEQNNQEFIVVNIDNEEPVIILADIQAQFSSNANHPWTNNLVPRLNIYKFIPDLDICFQIQGFLNNSSYLGSYAYYLYYESVDNPGFFLTDFPEYAPSCPNDMFDIYTNINITYNLTALGEVGEFIDINFNGSYEDNDGITHTINGEVHVLRDE